MLSYLVPSGAEQRERDGAVSFCAVSRYSRASQCNFGGKDLLPPSRILATARPPACPHLRRGAVATTTFLSSFDSSTPRSADQSAATPRRIVSSRIASAGGKKLAAEPGGAENYAANSRALNSGKCELWIQPCFACGGISRLSVEIANESRGCEEHVVSSKV